MAGSSLSYFFFFLREADKHVDRHAVRLISPPTIVLLVGSTREWRGETRAAEPNPNPVCSPHLRGKGLVHTIVLGIQDRKQKILYFVGGGPIRKDD